MKITEFKIKGCFLIKPKIFSDVRGCFVKTYQENFFNKAGIKTHFAEEFYSSSGKGVLRGMHFQSPPADHEKLVYCIRGSVLDVFLDLRKKSPTYSQFEAVELNAATSEEIFMARGIAHGFLSLTDGSMLVYKTSQVHSPQMDSGILWNSFGFEWPQNNPITSERDSQLTPFGEFNSPF